MLVDEFLPLYDVSDELAVIVEAEPVLTWKALMDTDLLEIGRLAGALGALRMLPDVVAQLAHGEPPPKPPERLTLRDPAELPSGEGGWVLLGERPGGTFGVGSGAHLVVNAVLEAVRENAERAAAAGG